MQSQIAWGILLMAAGLAITVISLIFVPFLALFYGLPLIAIGAALFIFRKREDVIEEARD
ncbi:hypothetical protein AZH53_00610 [Methanomicrobiaceae archaeon CYW5]|uniref:hypothetical protein n=1 Tax=Methanovulcanius yangii TaxID=1789227 RepID=UPI0029CA99B5|nr:hypothetical protein [Methanovulcanius yangii]MBT8506931.1 hypothetical protein [Methanovulcanius yangii]